MNTLHSPKGKRLKKKEFMYAIFPTSQRAHTTYPTWSQRHDETRRCDNVFYCLKMKVKTTSRRITTLSQRRDVVSTLK